MNVVFSAMPVTMPGSAIGSTTRNEIGVAAEEPVARDGDTRPACPSTSAIAVAPSPAFSEVSSASRTPGLWNALREPLSEKLLDRPALHAPPVEGVERDDQQREVQERERQRRRDRAAASGCRGETLHRLQRLERAQPPGDQEVDDHDDDRHRGERRRERQVVRDADVGVDDVADELRARHELRRDVVAERQREREDRARRPPPGSASGRTTRRNVGHGPAPRSPEASSSESGSRSSPA